MSECVFVRVCVCVCVCVGWRRTIETEQCLMPTVKGIDCQGHRLSRAIDWRDTGFQVCFYHSDAESLCSRFRAEAGAAVGL